MSNYLATFEDITIVGTLTKARDRSKNRVIQQQFLDGTYNVQTIGSAAKRIEVEFYCSTAVRRQIEDAASDADLIKVYWEDKIWTGNINKGEVDWKYFGTDEVVVNFDLLVYSEEDA